MRPPPLFQNHRGFSSFFRQIDLQDLYITLGSGLITLLYVQKSHGNINAACRSLRRRIRQRADCAKRMRPYVEATWPSDEEREEYYRLNRFQQNETEIIQVDGEDAGRITITRRPGCIVLEEIHIAPRFQGRGIGQMSIRKVLAEADERRISTELKVLKKNPAQKLYMRLGFVTVREADERLYMVRGVQQVEVADASTRRNS